MSDPSPSHSRDDDSSPDAENGLSGLPDAWGRTPEEPVSYADRVGRFPRPKRGGDDVMDDEDDGELSAGRRFPWWQAAAVLAVAAAAGTWLGSGGGDDAQPPAAPVEKPAPAAQPMAAVNPVTPPPGDPAAAVYAGGSSAPATVAAAVPPEPAPAATPAAASELMPAPVAPTAPPVVAAAETKPDVVFKPEDASIFDMDEKPSGDRPPERPAGNPVERPPGNEPEPSRPARELSKLELQYVTALEREAARAGVGERSAWEAEAAAVRSGGELDGDVASLPAGLQKMRRIFLEQRAAETGATAGGAPPADGPSAAARRIDLFVLADDGVRVFLNGDEQNGEYLVGREDTPGAIVRLGLTVEPGDVLGFHVRNRGGAAYFACAALAGVQRLFGSSARWESIADRPDATWLKGDGPAGTPSRELRPNVDYALGVAKLFEQRSNCGATAYRVIWPGGSDAGFRYRLRAADLPQKPNLPGR